MQNIDLNKKLNNNNKRINNISNNMIMITVSIFQDNIVSCMNAIEKTKLIYIFSENNDG